MPKPETILDPAVSTNYRDHRPAYTDAREAAVFELEEKKRADKLITRSIRDHCKPEIDEYIDCTTGKLAGVFMCKDLSLKMRRCLVKYKTNIDVDTERQKLIKSFEEKGEVLDRSVLSRRSNMFVSPEIHSESS
jgi:COX assembly mitochondrial protein 1